MPLSGIWVGIDHEANGRRAGDDPPNASESTKAGPTVQAPFVQRRSRAVRRAATSRLRRAAVAATLGRRDHRRPARAGPRRDVSATEFAFLAFGLVLGVAAGIALAMVVRSRPSSRQVRLTIAPGSVAVRRSQTLSSIEPEDHSAAAIGTPTAERTPVRPGPGSYPEPQAPGPALAPAAVPASTNPLAGMPATLAATRGKGPFTLSESAVGIPIDADEHRPGSRGAARRRAQDRGSGAGGRRDSAGTDVGCRHGHRLGGGRRGGHREDGALAPTRRAPRRLVCPAPPPSRTIRPASRPQPHPNPHPTSTTRRPAPRTSR